VVIKKNREHF